MPLSEAEAAIGKGSGNPEFKIARTAEDGEEEQQQGGGGGGSEQQGDAAAGKEGDAAVQALDKRLVERRRCGKMSSNFFCNLLSLRLEMFR